MEGQIKGSNCLHATHFDVGVSLHSRTHPLFMQHSNGSAMDIQACSFTFFVIPICPFLIKDLLVVNSVLAFKLVGVCNFTSQNIDKTKLSWQSFCQNYVCLSFLYHIMFI